MRGDDLLSSDGLESRTLTRGDHAAPLPYYAQPTSLPAVSETSALQIADVFSAVKILADSVASLPPRVYRRQPDGSPVEAGDDQRLVSLLRRPAPGETSADLFSDAMVSLLTHGSAYIAKYRTGNRIVQLGVLDPQAVQVERKGTRVGYTLNRPEGQSEHGPEDILAIHGMRTDRVAGASPVKQAAKVLQLNEALIVYACNFLGNAARPGGLLFANTAGLDRAGELIDAWQSRFAGHTTDGPPIVGQPHQAAGAGKIAVMSGDAKYEAVEPPMKDTEFLAQRELAAREVARIFSIPPWMLGVSSGDSLTYSNTWQQARHFLDFSLRPHLTRIERAFNADTDLLPGGAYLAFDAAAYLRLDADARAAFYESALRAGWMTIDEVRQAEDMEPLPENTIALPTDGQGERMGTEERQASPEEMRTVDVDVESIDTRGRTLHGYAAVYNVESEDLGGFRERIAPGAFSGVLGSDVRALLNHDPSQVLGRTRSGTLRLFDEQRGLRFEVDLPDSPLGENVREAVRRRDIDGASFRFKVGRDSWSGELRTIESVEQLKDVTVATFGAYPAASVELRTRPAQAEEETMSAEAQPAAEPVNQQTEERAEQPSPQPAGSLRVEERADGAAASGLWDEFRSRGFPRERAEVTWSEFESRALTWTPSVNLMNQLDRQSVPLGFDQRYAWPALQRVPVDSATTSVLVMSQTARSLATASNVVRSIDAVTAKPETGSTVNLVTVPLSQVATHSGAIPNVHLEQPALRSIVEGDMQLAINEGLDKIVIDTFAASGFQAPGTDNLVASVRKAMTTLQAAGYSPDVLILRPADSEALDLLVSGISGGTADYVFTPGQPAPNIWNLSRRISKTVAAPVVMDSTAYGKLYISPIGLAAFEQNGGTTNTSILRLEGHACCGVERQSAAIRIAAA